MTTERIAATPRPSAKVLLVSLALFGRYLIISLLAARLRSAPSLSLHPATRLLIWLALSAAVGYHLRRRNRRDPLLASLALAQGFAIGMLPAMSVAALLRLSDGSGEVGREMASFMFNALALLGVGAAGRHLSRLLFGRLNPSA